VGGEDEELLAAARGDRRAQCPARLDQDGLFDDRVKLAGDDIDAHRMFGES
jgi:hypothetical protein